MITRFAPSPTGPLHLGHAFSALTAFDLAQAADGTFILRMDDIDSARCKPQWEAQAIADLTWLGLNWPKPVLRQSRSQPKFKTALGQLATAGLLFPCRCQRADIAAAAGAPQEGVPTHGPDGRIYPGTCRHRQMSDIQPGDAIRLNMAKAIKALPDTLAFDETGPCASGHHVIDPETLLTATGDVVLARKTGDIAYHLAVVIDDHGQDITHVVRGMDLFDATQIHVLLHALLGLPSPTYHHHRLIRDDAGKRLAKRDDARAIAKYREDGATPEDIRRLLGLKSLCI